MEEATSCLAEARSIKKMVEAQIRGLNPEMSVIMGGSMRMEFSSLEHLIEAIREEIHSLQNIITVHYAESVGNECAVQ